MQETWIWSKKNQNIFWLFKIELLLKNLKLWKPDFLRTMRTGAGGGVSWHKIDFWGPPWFIWSLPIHTHNQGKTLNYKDRTGLSGHYPYTHTIRAKPLTIRTALVYLVITHTHTHRHTHNQGKNLNYKDRTGPTVHYTHTLVLYVNPSRVLRMVNYLVFWKINTTELWLMCNTLCYLYTINMFIFSWNLNLIYPPAAKRFAIKMTCHCHLVNGYLERRFK